jgi:hypothetical protein
MVCTYIVPIMILRPGALTDIYPVARTSSRRLPVRRATAPVQPNFAPSESNDAFDRIFRMNREANVRAFPTAAAPSVIPSQGPAPAQQRTQMQPTAESDRTLTPIPPDQVPRSPTPGPRNAPPHGHEHIWPDGPPPPGAIRIPPQRPDAEYGQSRPFDERERPHFYRQDYPAPGFGPRTGMDARRPDLRPDMPRHRPREDSDNRRSPSPLSDSPDVV